MTDKVTTRSRPSTHQILSRIIAAPDVALQVRGLPPAVLGGLIRRIGLEDAGELVAFATTQQLAAIFDEDLWRSDRAGQDETFDADRFVLWLEVLLEAGEQVVARRLAELPVDLVTLALHRQLLVVDMDALIPDMQEGGDEVDQIEKALSDCQFEELDAYRLIARHPDGWDVLWTAILALDRDHHDHLMRILDRCAALSAGDIDQQGGLYQVLTSEEMLAGDVAAEREDRRAEAGHVAPSSAAACLKLARRLDAAPDVRDPLTRAYFRGFSRKPAEVPMEPRGEAAEPTGTRQDLMTLLHDMDVEVGAAERDTARMLGAASAGTSSAAAGADQTEELALLQAVRALVDRGDAESQAAFVARSEELAYVANALAAGCSLRGGKLRPLDAVRAAVAACNVGLQLVSRAGRDVADPTQAHVQILLHTTADALFRRAWHHLHQHVTLRAAAVTVAWLRSQATHSGDPRSWDRQVARLQDLTREETPWRLVPAILQTCARAGSPEIEAVGTWLCGLIDECPRVQGAPTFTAGGRAGQTDSDEDLRVITTLADIAAIERQLDQVMERVSGMSAASADPAAAAHAGTTPGGRGRRPPPRSR